MATKEQIDSFRDEKVKILGDRVHSLETRMGNLENKVDKLNESTGIGFIRVLERFDNLRASIEGIAKNTHKH